MIRSNFLYYFKSTFALSVLLLSCRLCFAQPSTTIAQGELRLDGNIASFNAANGELVLDANQFTVASGKSSAINPVKSKSITINDKTQIVNSKGAAVTKSDLTNGAHIAVIGSDGGKTMAARLVILMDAAADQSTAPNSTSQAGGKDILHAGEYLLSGQIKGIFSAETIVIEVYKRTDAQGKVEELGQPVEQKLHLGANTKIFSAEDATKALTIGDIKLGQRVAVVGKYGGEDAPFKVRLMEVAKEETQNLEKVGVVQVNPQTAKFLDQGESALNTGAYPEALQYYTKASQIAGSLGDTGGNALAQSYLGMVYQYLNQPQKALAAFNTSISLSTGIGNYSASAVTMSNLGDFYIRQKDYADALKSFNTALGWIESNNFNGKDKLKMGVLQGEASALFQSQQPDKAIEIMHQSIALAQQLNDIERQGGGYLTLAFWQLNIHQTDEAKSNAKHSADLIPQLKNPAEQVQSWEQLYLFYRIINDDKETQNAYDQAQQILTNLKDEDGLKRLQQLKDGLDKNAKDKQTPTQ
ncbi:MAG: tetratricopeptide repeat protein [Abditibacteriaceae bacterium]